MLPKLPTKALPKSVHWQISSICWLFEKRRQILASLLAGLFLIWAFWAQSAQASCGSLPERQDEFCVAQGYGPAPCNPTWETDARGRLLGGIGTLTLISDDTVDEPLLEGDGRVATTLWFNTTKAEVVKTFSPVPDHPLGKLPQEPPCVIPRCTRNQAILGIENYLGLGPDALTNVDVILDKSLWNPPDDRMQDGLRAAHGATGTPIAVWAWPIKLNDQRGTGLATTLKIGVLFLFALPAE